MSPNNKHWILDNLCKLFISQLRKHQSKGSDLSKDGYDSKHGGTCWSPKEEEQGKCHQRKKANPTELAFKKYAEKMTQVKTWNIK